MQAGNLGHELTPLVGRAAELKAGRALLAGTRLLTITGPGGAGKTRLARHLAAERADVVEAVWFCDLTPLTSAASVPVAVAATLSVPDRRGRSTSEAVAREIGTRPMLLVLDNCEHVVEGAATLAMALLTACPELTIVATSREPLDVEGETAWALPPMSHGDSVALFVAAARRSRPGLVLDKASLATIDEICRGLDGLPLAIELAAAAVRTTPLDEVRRALASPLTFLTGPRRSAGERHGSLLDCISWSYRLLTDEERHALRVASVFAGSFCASQLVAVDPRLADDAQHLVSRLVDRSMIAFEPRNPRPYRLLEAVRQFAVSELRRSGEEERARTAHLEYLAGRSGVAIADWSSRTSFFKELDTEYPDFLAAVEYGIASGQLALAHEAARPLGMYWVIRGRASEGPRVLDELLARSDESLPVYLRCWAWFNRGWIANNTGDWLRGVQLLNEALSLARECGDSIVHANSLNLLGNIQLALGDPAGAVPLLEEALEVAQQSGDAWVLAGALYSRGSAHFFAGELQAGRKVLGQALLLAERCGYPRWYAEVALGGAEYLRGDLDSAERLLWSAVDSARASGDHVSLINAVTWLGQLRLLRPGETAELRRLLATERDRAIDDRGRAVVDACLARVELADGRLEEGAELLRAAAAAPAPSPAAALGPLCGLVSVELALGRVDSAAAAADEVERVASGAGLHPMVLSGVAIALARSRLAAGASSHALSPLLEALERCRPDFVLSMWQLLGVIAEVLVANGSHKEGVHLLAATEAFSRSRALSRSAVHQPFFDKALGRARTQLRAEDFAAAWKAGEALSLIAAGGRVLRRREGRKRPKAGWESLTPVELQVVDLVAAGRTNVEIAGELLVSPRTVSTHLTHVFSKLGLRSRTELASAACKRRVEAPTR